VKAERVDAALGEKLAQLFQLKTGMRADLIAKAPVTGMYEVAVGTTVYYMEPTGKWLFDGHLVNLDTRSSVTAARKLELERQEAPLLDWRALNLADAIKVQRGQATKGRVLVLVEDPRCSYCQRLQPELAKIPNLVTYTFPVALLGPDSQAQNESVWCAKDRAAAWASAMKGKALNGAVGCDTGSLARNAALAQKLKVQGTPTMFLADGSRLKGYMSAADIERALARITN
jgi:thiol:disulfide interchange protein DsbC